MMLMETQPVVRINIVGVGGAGCRAVDCIIEKNLPMVHTIAIDTSATAITKSKAEHELQIGTNTTNGLGTGSTPQKGQLAAEESYHQIEKAIKDCDMLFLTAGMGGGTGTAAASVVAEIARNHGILTIAVVTMPFCFEGHKRLQHAMDGIARLEQIADAVIVIPNDNLKLVAGTDIQFGNAFAISDKVLVDTVSHLTEVIRENLDINCDFADIQSVLQNAGRIHTTSCLVDGKHIANVIRKELSYSKLLGTSAEQAKRLMLCITASNDVEFEEIEEISAGIREIAHPDANIIFGIHLDNSMEDAIKAVLIASK